MWYNYDHKVFDAFDLRIGNIIAWRDKTGGAGYGVISEVTLDGYKFKSYGREVNGATVDPVYISKWLLLEAGYQETDNSVYVYAWADDNLATGILISLPDRADDENEKKAAPIDDTAPDTAIHLWVHKSYIHPPPGESDNQIFEMSREFKYLHQLQNAYFTLTGEELYMGALLEKVGESVFRVKMQNSRS